MVTDMKTETVTTSIVSFHYTITIRNIGSSPIFHFLSSCTESQRMIMTERDTQRSMDPIGINTSSDILKFVIVRSVKRPVGRFIQSGYSLEIKFLSRIRKIER